MDNCLDLANREYALRTEEDKNIDNYFKNCHLELICLKFSLHVLLVGEI